MHKDGLLGEIALKCSSGSCHNSLLLDFIPVQANLVVVLLCGQPCSSQTNTRTSTGAGPSGSPWARTNASWLVKIPLSRSCCRLAKSSPSRWTSWRAQKENSLATLEDLEKWGGEEDAALPPVVAGLLPEPEHYLALSLVKLKADYNQKLKKSPVQDNITIGWGLGLNQRITYFTLPKTDSGNEEWCQTSSETCGSCRGGDKCCWYKGDLVPKGKGISYSTRVPDDLAMRSPLSCKAV